MELAVFNPNLDKGQMGTWARWFFWLVFTGFKSRTNIEFALSVPQNRDPRLSQNHLIVRRESQEIIDQIQLQGQPWQNQKRLSSTPIAIETDILKHNPLRLRTQFKIRNRPQLQRQSSPFPTLTLCGFNQEAFERWRGVVKQ